ncbi:MULTISPECIES: YdcH family protein [Kordiimonas]|jgi:hypothetical protein|uniref:YdcH family protein n=1 Tax=Kordiimonas TaxID=288021 RepID=UPI00257951CF|nr:DUF465 domain-containing protein [Kordiimonas sp. UBA4487]
MGHMPHALREEFPEFADKLPRIEESDGHFRRLAEEYRSVNRAILELEAGDETNPHFDEEGLRKKRLFLKDEIYALLKEH